MANIVLFLFFISPYVMAIEVDQVANPTRSLSGYQSLVFAPDTSLRALNNAAVKISLKQYRGEWENGKASGFGTLDGYFVIKSSANEINAQLMSRDLAVRAMAETVVERVRTDAALLKIDPDQAVSNFLGDQRVQFRFIGNFVNGRANGPGRIETATRTLKGNFHDWKLDGLVTHLYGSSLVLLEMFSNGSPTNGPILINQYSGNTNFPTRTFVGVAKDGALKGDWFNSRVMWRGTTWSSSLMDGTILTVYDNGDRSECTYAAPPVSTTNLSKIRGLSEYGILGYSDETYQQSIIECKYSENGWTFRHSVSQTGPFAWKHKSPYYCWDPQRRSGVVTITKDDELSCTVTSTEMTYQWGKKIGLKLEHLAHEVRNIILTPIDAVGKAVATTICDVAQKEPGKDCNVSISYGQTFDVPDTEASRKLRAAADLEKFLQARQALQEKLSNDPNKTEWNTSANIFLGCAKSCAEPAQNFSMLAVQEINAILTSGFEEDIKRRRLASLSDTAWSIFSMFKPAIDAGASAYSYLNMQSDLFNAKVYLESLEPSPTMTATNIEGVRNELNILYFKYQTPAAMELASQFLYLLQDAAIQGLPGLPVKNQIALAIAFGISNPTQFFEKYKDFKSKEELVDKLIEIKFAKWKIPPPPPRKE
ncbi:hypothetical protein NX786_13350 [Telluria mixta]|uniref:Uncharacterized protein n=1 Tax=Telluria mixta TaxID=34071 RepID=A0ABT2BYV4_9BURK|nr:hypothetical protein [Telluria mixta]MCS0630323.1 hypothetical protein [Telluria mixta]WEM94367.1 hypothetical protein P0M04_23135 [Telluria mixta]